MGFRGPIKRIMRFSLVALFTPLVLLTAACTSSEDTAEVQATLGTDTVTVTDSETSEWKAGDTIPAGRPGVPDIRILEVHKNGEGPVCGMGKRASLKYVAMRADGSVLDPGTRPYTFGVGRGEAIRGWDVVVSQMRVGDSFTIWLPKQLAYGDQQGDLKFDMELLTFN
jgi:FKBP-type peptidyl-prolyl cis-trans isomerase